MKKEFLYFITNNDGKSYFVQNGLVKLSAQLIPLEHAPDGWSEQSLKWSRNKTYTGIISAYSVPLRFFKDSAKILRHILYNNSSTGIQEIANLVILKLNYNTGKHEDYFKGEIDFSKKQNSLNYFEVSINEGGFYKNLKAYESTQFEFKIDDLNPISIEMDGLMLQSTISWSTLNLTNIWPISEHRVPIAFINKEGTSFELLFDGQTYGNAFSGSQFNSSATPFIENTSSSPITVKSITGKIPITLISSNANRCFYTIRYYLYYGGTEHRFNVSSHTFSVGETFVFDVNFTNFVMPANSKLYLTGFTAANSPGDNIEFRIDFEENKLKANFDSRYKKTYIKAVNALKLGNALVKKMAGVQYELNSSLLKNCGIYITCGDAIRGLENSIIKTNFRDFFTSFFRNLNIGLTWDNFNSVFINTKENYYQNNVTQADLGIVKDFTYSFREDLFFSTLKIGYENQDYDDVNGKDEFNNTHVYSSPLSRSTNTLEIKGAYRSDPYGIEFLRINLEGKLTTDNKADTEIFIIDVLYNGEKYVLNRPAYSVITGVINPTTIFNTRLSPKNCLYKHGNTLRSILWHQQNSKLVFQTTEKNADLKTILNGVEVTENADVSISKLAAPLFIPIEVKFKTVVPTNILDIIGYGKYYFTTSNGIRMSGFIEDISVQPGKKQEQEWTLLLSPDNDITQLIYG